MTDKEIGIDKETPKKSSTAFDRKMESEKARFQLEQKAAERNERLRRNMLRAAIGFFWFLSAILAIAILAFSWHKLTPKEWHLLEKEQIDNIQTFLLSGALTAFLSSVGRNMLDLYRSEDPKKM